MLHTHNLGAIHPAYCAQTRHGAPAREAEHTHTTTQLFETLTRDHHKCHTPHHRRCYKPRRTRGRWRHVFHIHRSKAAQTPRCSNHPPNSFATIQPPEPTTKVKRSRHRELPPRALQRASLLVRCPARRTARGGQAINRAPAPQANEESRAANVRVCKCTEWVQLPVSGPVKRTAPRLIATCVSSPRASHRHACLS